MEVQSHAQLAMALLVPCLWMAASSGLIMLNKMLLKDLGFSYPIVLSVMGQLFTAIASFLVCPVFGLVNALQPISARLYITRILPMGLLMALTLFTGNAAYMHLSVSFIQMLKSMGPVITMAGLYFARVEIPTRSLCASVFAITIGTAIASYGEVNLDFTGCCYMMISSFSEAARLVMTQVLLQGMKFHPIEGTFAELACTSCKKAWESSAQYTWHGGGGSTGLMFLAPACVLWLLPGALLWEMPTIVSSHSYRIITANLGLFAMASCAGFAVTALSLFTIQLCGSLTLKVLGTVKSSLLVVLCVTLLSEVVTGMQGTGYFLSMVGFGCYQYLKMNTSTATAFPYKVCTSPEAPKVINAEHGQMGSANFLYTGT